MNTAVTEKTESYKKQMAGLQKEFAVLARSLEQSNRSLIVVLEGLDASGKSGCIRRLTRELDMKQFRVIPIAKPTKEEYRYPYLRRFWTTLPPYGGIAFYDRSWYGRVLVERIEGFCTKAEWTRAYGEINSFEKMLADDGAILIKMWFEVSPAEQLKRFQKRAETPEKQHKITEEDWRNRSKRPEYDAARDDMFRLTDAVPWHVLPADDKKSARIEAGNLLVQELSRALENTKS